MMYKIYVVSDSGEAMKLVCAYTNCLPISMDLLHNKANFLSELSSNQ